MENDKKGKEKKEGTTALATTLAYDKALGQIFVESGFFQDAKEQSQAVVKILAGREAGLQPIESMTGIHIIKGKITFGSNMMASAVKKHPNYDYRVVKHTEKECVIDFFEIIYDLKDRNPKKEKIGTSSFTYDEAKNIGLTSNTSWKNYPKAMLFARALSAGVRYYCPDVFGHAPAYVPEELGEEVNEDGEPINVTPANQPKVVKQDMQDADYGVTEMDVPIYNPEDDGIEETRPEEDEDTTTISLPDGLITDAMKPRDALEAIMEYALNKGIGSMVKPIVVKHYPKYDDDGREAYHIPESKVIKIVEELTGMKLKKAEKVGKCKECDKRITEPEGELQGGACLDCWQKSEGMP